MPSILTRSVVAALGIAALSSAQAVQLDLPRNAEPEIVVYGLPAEDGALGDFVREIGVETQSDQLARWRGAICPDVIGMREELNHYVRETIRSVADLAGARVRRPGCDHNVIVVMTANPQEFLQDIRAQRPDLFSSLSVREREAMVAAGEPVSIWSQIEIRGGDGRVMQSGDVSYNSRGSGVDIDALPYRRISGAQASRIARSVRSDLNFRAIIIDLSQLDGQTMQQLSAYAAMLTLGEFDISSPIAQQRTILNLFHDATASPADLTDWDLAYLRALYSTSASRDASRQRSAMIRHIRRNLGREE